ncbi:MAG: pirin family protein [Paludibacteraceae bacterium]|nr:pirin family protein [Paludibacteraceae bacterium]
MKTILHKSNTRGSTNERWLSSFHTFSFADYYDAERVHFGSLRVINDDTIAPGCGFGMHPHDNMEIVTIPLEGNLEHKDSMGNGTIIRHGEIQVMSAGTGITHSEFNPDKGQQTKLLQIWVIPNKRHVSPRYGQLSWMDYAKDNKWQQILSPFSDDAGVWIHQNAWFHIGTFDKDKEFSYSWKDKRNGLYIFVIDGTVTVENQILNTRDGYGIWETDQISFATATKSTILLMEVPMTL